MRVFFNICLVILASILLALPLLTACSKNDETSAPTISPTPTPTPSAIKAQETVKITIGNLSDLTGVSANAMGIINMALEDTVEYYNEQNLIPGVELEVITYDGQFNPARDISGYEWLKENGADLIFTAVPPTAVTLK
ncbi:MAG: ABC transporter substrate-binding protein, partial [Planctomycetes bacterium]|nr:ABC transporter substrate-binding protein [Planctomycetota bacterium]